MWTIDALKGRVTGASSQRSARLAVAVSALVLLAGCMNPSIDDPARIGPFHTASNHTGVPQLPVTLRRVLLLPVAGGNVAPEESAVELDPVFATELQKQNRFEVVTVSRQELSRHFHRRELSPAAALPSDFVAIVRGNYGADGVLFVELTAFKGYRPLVLGVRAKLAALDGSAPLLWSFDNVFSATDADVANGARNHYLESDRRGIPADFTQSALQSPSRFAGYVAAEMFETLPPVYGPQRQGKADAHGVANDR